MFADELQLAPAVVSGDIAGVRRAVDADASLAVQAASRGATRQEAQAFFIEAISHYVVAGDTHLHLAAAAFEKDVAELLLARGADVSAQNRHGAASLHYAADTNRWLPDAQVAVITCLLDHGAVVDAVDHRGVTALHRAVRTRSAPAVCVLLERGSDTRRPNGRGTLPLALAVQSTGRGGSGTDHAKAQQLQIVKHLLDHDADPHALDSRGAANLRRILGREA